MTQLKNIIFDLGNVLINLDFNKPTQAFRDLGFPHFENMYSQFKVDQLFEKLETGKISQKEFYTVLLKIGNARVVSEDIKEAWNSMLLDFREDSLAFLKVLKKQYNIFLLSNTNVIHYDAFNDIFKKQVGPGSLDDYFTKAYYSHLIGFRKPNSDIFDFVLKDAGITATDTIFIDDMAINVEAAKKMGFKTHQLLPGEKIELLTYD